MTPHNTLEEAGLYLTHISHSDLYLLPEDYEAMFSWNPKDGVEYLIGVTEKFIGHGKTR